MDDEDSEDSQNEEEDLIGNVTFASYLSTNVCSHMQKRQIILHRNYSWLQQYNNN